VEDKDKDLVYVEPFIEITITISWMLHWQQLIMPLVNISSRIASKDY
jgi:hypothetical protein